MPDLPRRTANLIVLGSLVVVLLAPMAVRSVTSVAADRIEEMLPAAPISVVSAPRGGLSGRQQGATVEVPGSDVELVITPALPTPASAPMEALLYMKPTPRPAPAAPSSPSGPVDGSVWDRLAQCESSGNWSINTGNGYYGGLQFSYDTWLAYGGGEFAEYAHLATREQQIIIAERLHAKRGFQPWPACRIKLGLP